MHKLIIHKLGPIDHAEIDVRRFMVFTGPQASGKSTIAKAIFFFRTIKDDIFELMRKESYITGKNDPDLFEAMKSALKSKFVSIFGANWNKENDMSASYAYDADTYVRIRPIPPLNGHSKDLLVEFSPNLRRFLNHWDATPWRIDGLSGLTAEEERQITKQTLNDLFNDKENTKYIPAGRSVLTLLSPQLNYLYYMMDDVQKQTIDFCTRSYLENVMKLRPALDQGLLGLEVKNSHASIERRRILDIAWELIENTLQGRYTYSNGVELLRIAEEEYVRINLASSGQQEVVWILNLLYFYLLYGNPTFIILEEPESNLFPEAQKMVVELIALAYNAGHSVLLTTHSPYVLGTINNLLYAGQLPEEQHAKVSEIINQRFWVKQEDISAFFLREGQPETAMDGKMGMIDNGLIDGISSIINDDFDRLLDVELEGSEA